MVGIVFTLVAKNRGEHWLLTKEEKDAFGEASENVLKHVPIPEKQAGIFFDCLGLGFCAFVIVAPRIEHDKERAEVIAASAVDEWRNRGSSGTPATVGQRNGEPSPADSERDASDLHI